MIERLRKQDRQWAWVRWLVLAMGFVFIGLAFMFGYILYWLTSKSGLDQAGSSVFLFTVLYCWTKGCLWFLFGIWCFVTVFIRWHGDVNRMLLLKLLDAQQKEKGGVRSH